MSEFSLLAPLGGWSVPLADVPDPVFATRMAGDGVAIDPTGATLRAPCDGTVIAVPDSRHAVTIRATCGAQILMHIGIDTVALGGDGFELHTGVGLEVRTGDPLISFDLDLLATRAKSLLTPIVLLAGDGFELANRSENRAIETGDFLMALRSIAGGVKPVTAERRGTQLARQLVIDLAHGIHARPAAMLATAIGRFDADLVVVARGRRANARSTVALMTLGAQHGEAIVVRASGPDAIAALDAFEMALRQAAQQEAASHAPLVPATIVSTGVVADDADMLRGVIANRGMAVGTAVRWSRIEIAVEEVGHGFAFETAELDRARGVVEQRLAGILGAGENLAIAHRAVLNDPELLASAGGLMARGKSAGFAWRQVIQDSIEALRMLHDPRMAERADDLADIETQVLRVLHGGHDVPPHPLPARAIVIARELLPSELMSLDANRIAGICTVLGGPTSHVAILAAALGIPALVAMGPALLEVPDGASLVLDADNGVLSLAPTAAALAAANTVVDARTQRRQARLHAAQTPCHTADGTRVEIWANVGSLADAQVAVRLGAEGCGLLRTEFLFFDRASPPDVAEQTTQYQGIAEALNGRPLTIRTLDAGGDKPMTYSPLPREENPALGLRGVRASLWKPQLLIEQLRAIVAVKPHGQCRIMLPMITDVAEIRAIRALVDEAARAAGREGAVGLGVMIETPAAAIMADRIAAVADFLSIGTNDLTQYTLAMDRGNAQLAARLDGLHPAVLRLIARTVEGALVHRRPVAVCGGLASDLDAVVLLIGLGVRKLSAVATVIPELKERIGRITVDACKGVAAKALAAESAQEVRELMAAFGTGARP